ncbi:MAG: circularly permuted type 2 ATP-grasp protein [Rubrobacter sp.]|nr:circularly permuted type 2 ATP-grasp protein [Rubrobacter sp.]
MKVKLEHSGPNEVLTADGEPRELYRPVLNELDEMGVEGWEERTGRAHEKLLAEQREYGIREGDKTHPADWFPRLISASDWERLERGLAQRLRAVNEFLRRLEAGKEEVVPREVIESSGLYDVSVPDRFGEVPTRQMGFDLVAVEAGGSGEAGVGWRYLVIEDNARMPVGAMSMSRMRALTQEVFPESYAALRVRPLGDLLGRLGEVLRAASPLPDPTLAILSTGPDDQYYLDHHLFAEHTGAILAERHEVELDGEGYLLHRGTGRRIDVIYERIEEGRIYDDLPKLIESHLEGKVQAIFAPNVNIVDDKGVYPFIPRMIRTYLGEEPITENIDTWSLAVEEDRRYVLEHFDELVTKSRGGWGGKDVLIAPEESKETIEEFRKMVEENPTEYIAQSPIDFSTHVLCNAGNGEFTLRDSYADYRVHALAPDPETVEVVPGAMTRVAAPGSRLVNISSGGVMKDTWVLG